jgi:4-hydroxyphenylpyruvate dioxygenase
MANGGLGIIGYDSFHFAVENPERSRRFYMDCFDFQEVAKSGPDLVSRSGQTSTVYGAGDVRVCVSSYGDASRKSKVSRYLRRHPSGIMSLSFRVQNLAGTMAFLESRGGTFLDEPVEHVESSGAYYKSVQIATPLGEVAFRFIERSDDYVNFAPGFENIGVGARAYPSNRYGISNIDHVTSNGLTMQPIVAWYRDVLGFETFWDISFHTKDVARSQVSGSGLKSIVMWDPESGVKFATNEPLRPFFRDSQIAKFVEDNGGPGVQHIAFAVPNIIATIDDLRTRGVEFLPTPKAYFDDLPRRLASLGITNVKEELAALERLQILVDGSDDKYMLQIFLREAASFYDDERAGPFFYEIIQRAGDPGFGYGNFRALFESIERVQRSESKTQGT